MNNPWENINLPSQNDVSARRIDHTHFLDLFWARDYTGHLLFIYEFPQEKLAATFNLPDLVGIQALYYQSSLSTNVNRLVLRLREQSNWEIFFSLCTDLVEATRQVKNSTSAIQIILRRLARWQEFLKKNRNDLLSEESIKGLIGELWFIKSYLIPIFGTQQAIGFWQGPEGLPQDFNVNSSAIEVKCQLGATTPYIKISSIDQLCPQLPEMYLFVLTLGKTSPETEAAINLPDLVSSIRHEIQLNAPGQIERFNDLLYLVGYVDSDRYIDFSYIVASEKMFFVEDGFPRLCFKDVPSGIVRITYDINLNDCMPFDGCPDWMRKQQ